MKCVLTIALLASCFGVAFAQDYRGKLQGLVTDPSQAVVAGAKVTLANINTGVTTTTQSNNVGIYRFDFVDPGTYRVEAEAAGFAKSIENEVTVQTQGDVTVNFTLQPGRVSQSVTVTANPVELQMNTATRELTVTSSQLTQLPFQDRSPFSAVLLDPAVVNIYPAAPEPYHMWQATEMDFGGGTTRENDVLIDGSTATIGPKGTYTPTIEGTQEVVVEQVAVDAEYGHSAGGVINMSTPQGTNKFHGSAFFFGINPALNAVSNAVDVPRSPSLSRDNIYGGSIGGPIKKNKLFNFFDYEGRRSSTPNTTIMTLPTATERQGDYSQSLNAAGDLRVIYNPLTTVVDPVTGLQTRTPFQGNVIPQSMLDPTALKMMSYIWKPNATPSNSAGANNFRSSVGLETKYYNFSDRVDWNKGEKLRIFGRYSQFHTLLALPDYTGINSPAEANGSGGLMLSKDFAADGTYTMNPSTVIDVHFGYTSMNDDISTMNFASSALADLWPSNTWYQPYNDQWGGKTLFPYLDIGGNSFSEQYLWFQHPHNYSLSGKVVKTQGRNTLKAGIETRRQYAFASLPTNMSFNFGAATTSSTSINAPTNVSGDPYATFLLGAPDDGSGAHYMTPSQVSVYYYGAYAQDDFKLSRRITLNLGLRYEYESAPVDAQNRYTRFLDFNTPNATLQANPPQYGADELALRGQYLGSAATNPAPNGNWIFATSTNRSQFNAPGFSLAPRAGIAFRINDKTVLNFGYGRFLALDSMVQNGMLANSSYDFAGYSVGTSILPSIQGVPVTQLSNPFPSNNPLQPPTGNKLGANTNLGNGFGDDWGDGIRDQNYKDGRIDRYNLTIQRELPGQLRAEVSFVESNGRNLDSYGNYDSFPGNEANPNLYYNPTTGKAMTVQYPNPFYQYLTPSQFPGGLRNQQTVSLWQLLRPYPQYGEIFLAHVPAEGNIDRKLEFRVQRNYSNGMNLLATYIYERQQYTAWPDAGDNVGSDGSYYYSQKPLWTEGTYPRHRMILSGIYDLPFGRGRKLMNHVNSWADGALGGWSVSSVTSIMSGDPLRFGGNYTVTGNPAQNVPAGSAFNTSVFSLLPAFAMFNGPFSFPGVDGPVRWNIDGRLSKSFRIREGMALQFRMDAYNFTNSIMWTDPDYSFGDSTFGQGHTAQSNIGRTLQYSLKFTF